MFFALPEITFILFAGNKENSFPVISAVQKASLVTHSVAVNENSKPRLLLVSEIPHVDASVLEPQRLLPMSTTLAPKPCVDNADVRSIGVCSIAVLKIARPLSVV